MANSYHKNQTVKITLIFTLNGVATDPNTVTLKVKDPSGNVASYTYALGEIIKDSVGNYHKDMLLDESGNWPYERLGTGTVAAADEDYMVCLPSEF